MKKEEKAHNEPQHIPREKVRLRLRLSAKELLYQPCGWQGLIQGAENSNARSVPRPEKKLKRKQGRLNGAIIRVTRERRVQLRGLTE